jgi:murein DD-endopeptidase MepM/ murein hydrolase activator NlpD
MKGLAVKQACYMAKSRKGRQPYRNSRQMQHFGFLNSVIELATKFAILRAFLSATRPIQLVVITRKQNIEKRAMAKSPQWKNLLNDIFSSFPRHHLVIASWLVVVLATTLTFFPSDNAEAKRSQLEIENNLVELNIDASSSSNSADDIITNMAALTEEQLDPWTTLEVKRGDNLASLFKRAGLSSQEMQIVLDSSKEAKNNLRNLSPGQQVSFLTNEQNKLVGLRHVKGALEATLYQRDESHFKIQHEVRDPEIRIQVAVGTISSSLFRDASAAGLPDKMILDVANLFSGVIDFVYEVHAGDRFTVMYEEKFVDGERIGYGNILAAEFSNSGKNHDAYRYTFADGTSSYFSSEGVSLKRAFLRAPLDFIRISSNFNPRRLHPVLKTLKPHRGTDYAAPVGTPVYASGDGRVVDSGFKESNGNYVVIQHGNSYTTKYLHLKKRSVQRGDRVQQGQTIGLVGCTGWCTGPHLHYEFLVDGAHRNPATIVNQLPRAQTLAKAEMRRFTKAISGLKTQLAAKQQHIYAENTDHAERENTTL